MSAADRFWMWLAWHLPRPLVYHAAARAAVNATTGRHSGAIVGDTTILEMLERWRSAQ